MNRHISALQVHGDFSSWLLGNATERGKKPAGAGGSVRGCIGCAAHSLHRNDGDFWRRADGIAICITLSRQMQGPGDDFGVHPAAGRSSTLSLELHEADGPDSRVHGKDAQAGPASPCKAIERAVPQPALRDSLMRDRESTDLLLRLETGVLEDMRRRIPGSDNDIRATRGGMSWPLEQIRVPLLVVHGMKDTVVPYLQAEQLTKRVPGAELLSMKDGEHVSIFTHRAPIRERIDAFLSAIDRNTHEER